MFGANLFDYLGQNVDAADAFNQGMTNVSSILAYAVLMAYDFAGISSIVDVGGGQGKLLEKILQFNPDIEGTVFDTASTIKLQRDSSAITHGVGDARTLLGISSPRFHKEQTLTFCVG